MFGASEGLAAADQERQDKIMQRLGLLDDTSAGTEKKTDAETGSVKEHRESDDKVEKA